MYDLRYGDCFKLLNDIPDKSIDLILTDPPYNIAQYSTGNIILPGRSILNNDIGEWDKFEIDHKRLLPIFKRIIKPKGNIFIFTTYNQIGKWHEVFDKEFDTFQFMVWHKTNPTPKIYKNGFLNSCELIICMWNKGHKWNFTNQKDMHNFIESPICSYPERLKYPKHPAQKPVKILKHIIELASDENDIILDPFMGVGSTGIAAYRLKRHFIGIEIEENFFKAAKRRFLGEQH